MDFEVAILAGGHSRRMGQDKANMLLGSRTLLEICVDNALSWQPRRVMVLGPNREWSGVEFVPDIEQGDPSSLKGVWSALVAARSPWLVVLGCDMPFVSGEVIGLLLAHRNKGGAGAWWQDRIQPLPMLLPVEACQIAAELLKQSRYHLAALQDCLEPGVVPEHLVQEADPQGLSFFNINTPQDLALAQSLLKE